MEPKVYSVSDIMDILCISRTKAYDFIKRVYEDNGSFRVVLVGGNYRILKASFDKWLEGP